MLPCVCKYHMFRNRAATLAYLKGSAREDFYHHIFQKLFGFVALGILLLTGLQQGRELHNFVVQAC